MENGHEDGVKANHKLGFVDGSIPALLPNDPMQFQRRLKKALDEKSKKPASITNDQWDELDEKVIHQSNFARPMRCLAKLPMKKMLQLYG
ncbi:hypothetical protein Lal_00029905 [Lupinus albus]|nr:hypothetical protein Lal_00029905 [Lupinus albus]